MPRNNRGDVESSQLKPLAEMKPLAASATYYYYYNTNNYYYYHYY